MSTNTSQDLNPPPLTAQEAIGGTSGLAVVLRGILHAAGPTEVASMYHRSTMGSSDGAGNVGRFAILRSSSWSSAGLTGRKHPGAMARGRNNILLP